MFGSFPTPMRLPPLLPVLALLLVTACSSTAVPPPPAGVVTAHGRLQVKGNRITGSKDGQPVSLAGNSFFWSQWSGRFYTREVVAWLKQDWHATVVRAALGVHEEDGYLQHPAENLARVTTVIDAAIAEDLYVIVDWHDHNAQLHSPQALAFFQEIARRYRGRPNLIYEIYNEPRKGYTWDKDVKPYAESVISSIRAIDPDVLIVVGTPNWSQDVDIAAADPIQDNNVAYTLHFYAASHKEGLRAKAKKALDLGVALFVTEWGTCNASGGEPIDPASIAAWMQFMREHQISHCNWSVFDKKETASIVVPGASAQGGWTDADLTPSGRLVREIVRNWNGGK